MGHIFLIHAETIINENIKFKEKVLLKLKSHKQ